MRQDGDLAHQHRAAAQSLQETRADQHRDVFRHSAGERGQRESGDAGDEDTFAAEAIGQRARRHQHHRHADRISIHDPLKLPEIRVQHLFECWQDRRNAGNFQSEHQGGETDGSERHGASAARWCGNGKGHSSAFHGSARNGENRSVEETG
ncbi:hypothetical protein D3C72_1428980 [compost metagenome]